MRAALIATILAASAASMTAVTATAAADSPPAAPGAITPNTPAPTHESPLIAYALELGHSESRSEIRSLHMANTALRAVTFEMSRHPPPSDEDCAHTLGASRFAQQYAQLATIQDQLGNFKAVIEANQSALACAPRVASYEASIASAHVTLDEIAEARAAVERGYALDPEDQAVREVRARLDFVQERWADATARFRLQMLEEKYAGPPSIDYVRCYLWLAQRRAGVRNPDLPQIATTELKSPDAPQEKHWPAQILDTLRGELSEAGLVHVIREDGAREPREWLTEALFYVGELRLAEGDAETARRHFATVVNLRVLNFVEYGMARAELKKMRERAPVADAAPSPTGTRAR